MEQLYFVTYMKVEGPGKYTFDHPRLLAPAPITTEARAFDLIKALRKRFGQSAGLVSLIPLEK